ncbi:MAG: hypothetical protein AAF570_03310, partial [Bacteroidota bacterium]
ACTDNQRVIYPLISTGDLASVKVLSAGTAGNLKLVPGSTIQLGTQVIFVTNGATPGKMDVLIFEAGGVGPGNVHLGLSADPTP